MVDNTQQARALVSELKDLNRNMSKLITILGCIERNAREVTNGTSKNEQKAVEEKKDEGQ